MSIPPTAGLPEGVARVEVSTARGPLAALRAPAAAGARAGAPVLLVPGYTGSKEDFIAVLAPLARAGHEALSYDQRGQHESPPASDPADYDLPRLSADAIDIARGLSPSGVHLVGHSWGGLVARQAVLADHAAFRSLTLLSSGPARVPGNRAQHARLLLDVLPTHSLETIWGMTRALEAEQGLPTPPPEIDAFLHKRWLRNDPRQLERFGQQLLTEPDRVDELAAVPLPKLVAYGADDNAWPPRLQERMAERLGARRVVIDGAAHSAAAENPVRTVEVLTAFFAAVEAAG